MAERRIAEKTGRGVVCFISNYSWLDGLSFTGMRERYLEAFDAIRIDNLHGDRIISEYAPDGRTSETVFAVQEQSPGIKIGTAITLLSRAGDISGPIVNGRIRYRDFHQARAEERRSALLSSLDSAEIDSGYTEMQPQLEIGLPFKPMSVGEGWQDWPSLPDLFPTSFPGVKTSRDSFLIDVDLDRLKERVGDYFNSELSHEEIARRYPSVMNSSARFNSRAVRDSLLKRDKPDEKSDFVRHSYRPFDNRWLYWEAETKLLDEKRADYKPHVIAGNIWLVAQQKPRREWSSPQVIVNIGCLDLMDRGATCFSAWLRDEGLGLGTDGAQRRPNLSPAAQRYLDRLGLRVEDLFQHALAVLHDPAYREANAGALRMEWPRIPLPGWPDGDAPGATDDLAASAARGRELAALLDPETPVPGVTAGPLHPELAAIAVPSTADGHNMADEDFALTAGWGHFGTGEAVMPGTGHSAPRNFTALERDTLDNAADVLGNSTFDIHMNDKMNDNARWSNVPAAVWNYKLGGYQVLKKWLSYREHKVLGRNLRPEEVRHFTDTARRIAAILMLTKQQ